MNVAGLLTKGRRTYLGLMQDTCRVVRPGGRGVFDEDTGQYTATEPTVLYPTAGEVADGNPGWCVVTSASRAVVPTEESAGERLISLRRFRVSLPFSAVTPIRAGDVVEVLTVGPTGDPWLVGRSLTVASAALSDLSVSRDLVIEEQT